jgi:hypothetical protein
LGGDQLMRAVIVGLVTAVVSSCSTLEPHQQPHSPCETFLAGTPDLNAKGMFDAAAACAGEGRKEDANRLMMLGQIRAVTDMSVLEPADEDAMTAAGELYGAIFYRLGGLGFDEVYRDPAAVERLANDIAAARLRHEPGYNPGWPYKPSSKTDVYDMLIENAKQRRIWQMRNVAVKLQNDVYYAAQLALSELQRETGAFQEGTPAWDEMERLNAIMSNAAAALPELPEPKYDVPYARLTEPDPEVEAMVVASGFNGPAERTAEIFDSEADVRASWLSRALSAQQMDAMLAKVRFGEQVLISYSFGRRTNASSQIQLVRLVFEKRFDSYSIGTRLGVVADTCGQVETASYPFIVGVIAAVPDAEIGGSSSSNYPAECGPIQTGEPSAPP